mmetsp:Transcript_8335/g.31162  ORF Transcript_8335/g.31162 Transcript_8335/m.31162 type:complete len:206 (-) Transcript_8335:607-1224(-)
MRRAGFGVTRLFELTRARRDGLISLITTTLLTTQYLPTITASRTSPVRSTCPGRRLVSGSSPCALRSRWCRPGRRSRTWRRRTPHPRKRPTFRRGERKPRGLFPGLERNSRCSSRPLSRSLETKARLFFSKPARIQSRRGRTRFRPKRRRRKRTSRRLLIRPLFRFPSLFAPPTKHRFHKDSNRRRLQRTRGTSFHRTLDFASTC